MMRVCIVLQFCFIVSCVVRAGFVFVFCDVGVIENCLFHISWWYFSCV